MKSSSSRSPEVRRITESDRHCFFGYYDVQAWSPDKKQHLCHRVKFRDRLPMQNDVAEIGVIDLESLKYEKLADTTAWNFQQGAMLQYLPGSEGREIVFNVRKDGAYRGCIMDMHGGHRKILERPLANVSPDGKFGLSINFDRMFAFRPGYGYAGGPDARLAEDHPDDDGVFLIDMESGKARLIMSLDQIHGFSKDWLLPGHHKLVVNHLGFNTDGTRFVVLTRYFPPPGTFSQTMLTTAAGDGSDAYHLTEDYRYASHYNWKNPSQLLIHAGGATGNQLYLLTDKSHKADVIDAGVFTSDGHCSYSPDRKWIMYDSYPDNERREHLFIYHVERREKIELGRFLSTHTGSTDIRCDLHPRWSPDGKSVSFDSTHEGFRGIYSIDLEGVV